MKTRLITTAIVLTLAFPWATANAQTWPGPAQLEAAEAQRRAEEQARQDEIAKERQARLDELLEPWLNPSESSADQGGQVPEAVWPQPVFQTF